MMPKDSDMGFRHTEQPRYNLETELAIQEAQDIMVGRIQAKYYDSLTEAINEIAMEK